MPHAEIITRDGESFIGVQTTWTEKELIKSVPSSRWDGDAKIWFTPLSWAACLQLRGLFGKGLGVGPELAAWSQREVIDRITPAMELREKITRTHGSFPSELYDFQTTGAAFLLRAGNGLLGDDMGLGKTAQILAALDALIQLPTGDALPALVICPNSVKSGWASQAAKWKTQVHTYVVEGGATARRRILAEARQDPQALVIVNTESVRLFSRLAPYGSVRLARCRECSPHGEERLTTSRCEVHTKELNGFGFRTVIMDEAHALKDPRSKQTRAVWAVGHDSAVRRRWALTGTPIANHIGDLWAVMHFVSPIEYPVKSKFVDRYALQAWNAFGGMDIIGVNPEHREEFYRILDPRFRRTPKALVLHQLPKVIRPTRWVEMVPKQERAYREIEDQMLTRMEDGQVMIAPDNLMRALRLSQLASSYADIEWIVAPTSAKDKCGCLSTGLAQHADHCKYRMKMLVHLAEPSPKLDAVMEDIEMLLPKQVVVAAQSRQLIELLAKRLTKVKIAHSMLTGRIPDYERNLQKQSFINGDTRVMLMTIQAGGTGVDGLQVADTMLCLQRSWSMLQNLQLDGRVDRIGSEIHSSVTIVDYVTRNTVEVDLFARLEEKWRRLEEINRDRSRLTAAGLTPEDRYRLDHEENQIRNAWLGAP